jgi:hypothetical protein
MRQGSLRAVQDGDCVVSHRFCLSGTVAGYGAPGKKKRMGTNLILARVGRNFLLRCLADYGKSRD